MSKKEYMNQILKRLELIKTSISIDEHEIIELQVMKLEKLTLDSEVQDILIKIENLDYTTVKSDIEQYISKYTRLVSYIDSEVQGLKLELKSLESNLQELSIQKQECLNYIEEFNTQYNLHLGDIIKSILSLKKEILYKQTIKQQKEKEKFQEDIQTFEETKKTITELKNTFDELNEALESIDKDDENYEELTSAYNELQEELEKLEEELQIQEEELEKIKKFIEDKEVENEYKNAWKTYEQFENEYEHIKDEQDSKLKISDDEKKVLKKLYKKAARLCHPDIVSDELKEKAHELMQKLNEAYSKKDISKVKEILHSLQNGTSFEVSSDAIEDKELLKTKIKEYKENIKTIKSEIDEIKEDDTYQTISSLDDWDEYFEEMKSELEKEKNRLESEAGEIFEEKNNETKPESQIIKNEDLNWIEKIWYWADEHNLSVVKVLRQKETLLSIKTLDLRDTKLKYLPKEIVNLPNLQELVLWGCGLKYLPKDIIKLTTLKKLNLRGNPELRITTNQKVWLSNLEENFCIVFNSDFKIIEENDLNALEDTNKYLDDINNLDIEHISNIINNWIIDEFKKLHNINLNYSSKAHIRVQAESKKIANDLNIKGYSSINLKYITENNSKPLHFTIEEVTEETFCIANINRIYKKDKIFSSIKRENKSKNIEKESSYYTKHISSIENIKFEKIRKYCENLSKDNEADEMQKLLGEKGRMYKALIYSSLETFIEKLDGKTITLCDWGCDQGIASMLVLDYIKEKQLDIIVSDVLLIDDDTKVLSRAIAQVKALAQDDINITAPKSDDKSILDTIKVNKDSTILNLFANDKIPIGFLAIEYDIFYKDFVLCVSNENKKFVDEVYENFKDFTNVQDMSIRDSKIGKFEKFERIFEIDGNEIPF